MRVLLIADYSVSPELAAGHFAQHGFAVDAVAGVEAARAALHAVSYDAVLLDPSLADNGGMALLQEVRSTDSRLPVVIVTARDAVQDRVRGLDAGADNYIGRPFDVRELEARLRAVLRRPGLRQNQLLRCSDLIFDLGSREVTVCGERLDLTRRESDLLEALLQAGGRMVARHELEEHLYSSLGMLTPNALEATVSRLRRRLVDMGMRIESRRGIGYRLIADG